MISCFQLARRKTRYFDNSLVHLTKHRVLQTLLVLTAADLGAELASQVFSKVATSILMENHLPSTRYLSEWILARLLLRNWDILKEEFERFYREASTTRLTCISSFLGVRAQVP